MEIKKKKKKKGGMIKDKKESQEMGQEGKTKIRNYKVNGLSRQILIIQKQIRKVKPQCS